MRIAILSLYSGDKFKRDTTYGKQTIINYSEIHGYDFLYDNEDIIKEHDREIQWTKILIIQKYLKEEYNYDYLVWIDADIVILNPQKTLESFISRLMNNRDIMYSKDFGGWVNNGVIFIKNTPFSHEYFKEVWNYTNEICREQGAMDLLYRMNWKESQEHMQITEDPKEYNPVWFQYEYGIFLMHFPGCGEPNRKANSLKIMMDMFTPIKMEEDTDETYQKRLKWLKEEAETELKYKKQLCIQQGWKYLPIDLD